MVDMAQALSVGLAPSMGRALAYKPDEAAFRQWIQALPWFAEFRQNYGEAPDLNSRDYDYRAAWRAGVAPERDPYDRGRYHWPTTTADGRELKGELHPTKWMNDFMSLYGVTPEAFGLRTPADWAGWLGGGR